uniref:U13-Theraphotoxin-Ct1a_1 n=1 Tax=Coremiocnemis tropix TaxID=1904443 RepID=A0A482ZCM2_CORTR
MKTSILVVILGLTLLFSLSAATELKDGERDCKNFHGYCTTDLDCCTGYVCSRKLRLCVQTSSPFRR